MRLFETKYGYFDSRNDAYVVTDPYTPLPWVNIICPDDLGVAVTAAGDGFTWHGHAGYNMVTRWIQDFSTQGWGKFIYLAEEEEGRLWSAALSPCRQQYRSYKAVHGIGYTEFIQVYAGIESRWKITVDPDRNIELWRLTLRNLCSRPRTLTVFPYLEWCLGRGAPHHRAIHECFFKTTCEGNRVTATRSMWDMPGRGGHWNTPYPYWAFLATERAPSAWESLRALLMVSGLNLSAAHAVSTLVPSVSTASMRQGMRDASTSASTE